MSTSNLGKFILWLFLVIFTINMLVNLFRQIYKYKTLKRRLNQREEYQKKLTQESFNLEKKLELVQSPEYIKEQAQKLLGEKTAVSGSKNDDFKAVDQLLLRSQPNYQKWLNLFFRK